jgi:hypothetical protein
VQWTDPTQQNHAAGTGRTARRPLPG